VAAIVAAIIPGEGMMTDKHRLYLTWVPSKGTLEDGPGLKYCISAKRMTCNTCKAVGNTVLLEIVGDVCAAAYVYTP
jgi:hypothetical protein